MMPVAAAVIAPSGACRDNRRLAMREPVWTIRASAAFFSWRLR